MLKMYFMLCAALYMALCISACTSGSQAKNAGQKEHLPVITLSARDTILEHPYVADIQAIRNVEIRSRVKGFLEKIYVDEGMYVRNGQKLFHINDEEYRAAVARAKAALTGAVADAKAVELEKERVQMLVDKKVISASELAVTEAKLKAIHSKIIEAKTALANSNRKLSYTTVRAPFSGYMNRIPLKTGSLIDEGTLLSGVSDISSVFAYFELPETEYLHFVRSKKNVQADAGNAVKLILADGSVYPHPGKIETVEGEIEQTTGSIAFRARFSNPEKLLRHGATGRLFIPSRVDSMILVPQQSVFEIQDKSYVYLVDRTNQLSMKNIEPETRLSKFYLVKKGLRPNDRILYQGVQNVRDGMSIIPEAVNADSLYQAN